MEEGSASFRGNEKALEQPISDGLQLPAEVRRASSYTELGCVRLILEFAHVETQGLHRTLAPTRSVA